MSGAPANIGRPRAIRGRWRRDWYSVIRGLDAMAYNQGLKGRFERGASLQSPGRQNGSGPANQLYSDTTEPSGEYRGAAGPGMTIDVSKRFSDKQEENRQARAEKSAELRRTKALQELGADEDDRLQKILKELIEFRKRKSG